MIPLYKLFVVTARLFTKPILTIIKKRHKSAKDLSNSRLGRFLILLGNREHRMDLWMNRKILSITDDSDMFAKPLNNDIAIEKGLEFFYECLVYFIIISLTVWELNRTSVDSKMQREKDAKSIEELRVRISSLESISANYIEVLKKIENKITNIDTIVKQNVQKDLASVIKEIPIEDSIKNAD